MTTREEFKGLINNLVRSVDRTQYADGCIEERREVLAAYDAQAVRIVELEAALRGLYDHTKNNQQICGLNERARAVLNKEA